jgi:hypothetical protein
MLGNTTPNPHCECPNPLGNTTTICRAAAELLARNLFVAGMPGSGKAAR